LVSNKNKAWIRRGLRGFASAVFIFSLAVYLGVELPFFNHWNPLYNPYYFVMIGVLFFAVIPTLVKDSKKLLHLLDFFDRSGTVIKTYNIPVENIKPTHINFVDKEGDKQGVRHGHPFTIFDDDGNITKEYLTPINGLEALNPTRLIQKYGQKATYVTKEIVDGVEKSVVHTGMRDYDIEQLLAIGSKYQISELTALDPHVLSDTEVEADDPDGLNQEAAYQTAEIRKGWFAGTHTGTMIMYIAVGMAMGGFAVMLGLMAAHVDFSHLQGVIRP